jgi:aminoglycoside phosphotransferase
MPADCAAVLPEPVWEQIWVKPGSEVWRVDTTAGGRYVKIAAGAEEAQLDDEAHRLEWAHGRLPVPTPEVLARAQGADDRSWLVTAALEGVPAHDPGWRVDRVEAMVEGVGAGLRRLHDTDPAACPFRIGVEDLLASATERVAAGGVDPTSMASPTYRRHDAESLLDHLRATRPVEPAADLVVAHGDAVLPNVLLRPSPSRQDGAVLTGLVDLGRLGVSDRYRDLALVARSLVLNVGPEPTWRPFDAYGLPHPDPLRMEWYALADDMW